MPSLTWIIFICFVNVLLPDSPVPVSTITKSINIQRWHLADKEHSSTKSVIYLFGILRLFQHCTGHITTGSWKGRGNQYIQFVRVLYCKLPTNGKQLPAFPLETVPGIEPRPQRWEARVLPLCHLGPPNKILQESSNGSVNHWLFMSPFK